MQTLTQTPHAELEPGQTTLMIPAQAEPASSKEAMNGSLVDRFTDRRIQTATHAAVRNALAEMNFDDPMTNRVQHAERVTAHTPIDTTPKPVQPGRLRPQDLGRQK